MITKHAYNFTTETDVNGEVKTKLKKTFVRHFCWDDFPDLRDVFIN